MDLRTKLTAVLSLVSLIVVVLIFALYGSVIGAWFVFVLIFFFTFVGALVITRIIWEYIVGLSTKNKLLFGIMLIIIIILSGVSLTLFYQVNNLQQKNKDLQNQISILNTLLQNQTIRLENQMRALQELGNQTSHIDILVYPARIFNFSQTAGPETVVFWASDYGFRISILNTSDNTIPSSTLLVNVTCSDGETNYPWSSYTINPFKVGEVQTVTGSIIVGNFFANLYNVRLTWFFTLEINTSVVAQEIFYS